MKVISEKEVLAIIEFEEKWLMGAGKPNGDVLIALDSIKSKVKDKSIEPCEDAISRVEMIKIADELECVDGIINAEKLRTEICLMPLVYPKAKVGKWITWSEEIIHDGYSEYVTHCKCSECKKEYDSYFSHFINYCSNCGAKMEGVQEWQEKMH